MLDSGCADILSVGFEGSNFLGKDFNFFWDVKNMNFLFFSFIIL